MLEDGKFVKPTEINIPESISELNYYALYNVKTIDKLVLPSSLTHIHYYNFSETTEINEVYFNGTLEAWLNIRIETWESNPMYYAKHFYLRDENNEWIELEDIVISEGTKEIRSNIFVGNKKFYRLTNLLLHK